jgi:hypothetical protein
MAIAAIFALAGCGDDGGDEASTPTEEPTATETATPAPALDELLEEVEANENTTTPATGLNEQQFNELLAELKAAATPSGRAASALRAVNSAWNVRAADLDEFARLACNVSIYQAFDLLRAVVPGAGLRALPGLNQTLLLVPTKCTITRPVVLERLNNLVVGWALDNEPDPVAAIPASPQTETTGDDGPPDVLYTGTCAALDAGLGYATWVKARVQGGGKGGVALAIALAAGIAVCPDALKAAIE